MQGFFKYPPHGRRLAREARADLIRREMRFVLQKDERRFTRQLLARLLDEGCNLHPQLARAMFCERFSDSLFSALPPEDRSRCYSRPQDPAVTVFHCRFTAAVKYLCGRLPDAETQMTAAVLDAVETLKLDWLQTAHHCLASLKPGARALPDLVANIKTANPAGKLDRHGTDRICRRLTIATVASLMRHARDPDSLRKKHGRLTHMLQRLAPDPMLLPPLLVELEAQVPYARHVVARTFWRTMNNLDNEIPDMD